jgi:hypothetical protein
MKIKLRAVHSSFVFLLTLLMLFVSCSSNISLTTPEINRALPENTPDSCEQFAGKWFSNKFNNIEDADKIICGDKACNDGNTGGGSFILTCTDGKISGEVILMSATKHTFSNVNVSVPIEKHETIEEEKTSFKDIRIENGVLHLSYIYESGGNCLREISVSPKGKFLLGKYRTTGCNQVSSSGETGSILFVRRR